MLAAVHATKNDWLHVGIWCKFLPT